jgi:hypothetical protein
MMIVDQIQLKGVQLWKRNVFAISSQKSIQMAFTVEYKEGPIYPTKRLPFLLFIFLSLDSS